MANSTNDQHPWFKTYQSRPNAKYQVFIFPSAGNPGQYYREWDKHFLDCEFSLIIYPGRTTRMREKLITNIQEYLNQMDKGLVPFINRPCIFIGHSLGSVINFALAKHMVETRNKGHLIRLMVQMGRGPPHIKVLGKSFADMTAAETTEELKTIADPSTKHLYDYPDYVEMLLPMLRADALVGYGLVEKAVLDIPIIVYAGEKELQEESLLHRWKELTTADDLFRVRMFPGHHNFQAECGAQVLQCLKEDFDNVINRSKY